MWIAIDSEIMDELPTFEFEAPLDFDMGFELFIHSLDLCDAEKWCLALEKDERKQRDYYMGCEYLHYGSIRFVYNRAIGRDAPCQSSIPNWIFGQSYDSLLRCLPFTPNQMSIIKIPPGSAIHPITESRIYFGDVIAITVLGGPIVVLLETAHGKAASIAEVLLTPGSIILYYGKLRYQGRWSTSTDTGIVDDFGIMRPRTTVYCLVLRKSF